MLRVVIADDEVRICSLLRVLVDWEALGFEIAAEEHDGQSLIERVREVKPELVITDIRMPGLSGLELLRQLREEGNHVEVLIMSGYREFDYVHEALRNGATDYLLKPINKHVLEEALRGVRGRVQEDMRKETEREQAKEVLQYASAQRGRELMEAVLSGSLKKASAEQLSSQYQCRLSGKPLYFVTLKAGIRDFGMEKAAVLMNRKFTGQIEQVFREEDAFCACVMRQNFHYILTEAESREQLEEKLYRLVRGLKVFLSQVESSIVAAGAAEADGADLPGSLEKSRQAMLDHLIRGNGQVFFYQDSERFSPDRLINIRSAALLQQALTNCADGALTAALDGLVKQIRDTCKSGADLQDCMEALQKQLVHVVEHLHAEEEIRSIPDRYTGLLSCCGDPATFAQLFRSEAGKLTEEITELQNSKEKKPVRLLRQIIAERYMEPLSLEDLAEELQMTPAYISRLFKKEIGENFSAYLNSVRLEKAKEMLSMTDEPVSSIALSIGYSDEKYFMRLFKKEIGLTAGEYRRLYGE